MASTNQSPQYQKAESKFLSAQNDGQRLEALEEMIKECPKHKSAEKMLAQLKTRFKKLKEKIERYKKVSKTSGKKGIKKEDMQAAIIGFTNSGKSSLISSLTNAKPKISSGENVSFTTKTPEIGMINYGQGIKIQLIEIPAIESEYYDKGLTNSADVILILVTKLAQIEEIRKHLEKVKGKQLIVFNKTDLLSNDEKRKITANLQSKKYNFTIISNKNYGGLEELKNKIFQSFDKIRVYTKEPGKNKSENPIILDENSTVKDIAKKVFKNIEKIKESRITGPSSKFSNQIVSLTHVLKDMDIIEFKLKLNL
ncbi:50S ribosome-binding GTPase [Candidatus Pacearchaeota archaeon]|nr:50S ribosome-binding GTPase [Candidatus Pacearchaeota archaeon]